jgi:hypothetical protein
LGVPSIATIFLSSFPSTTENTAVGIRHADHVAPLYAQKLALTSPTSGGHSVGVVRSRTQATEFPPPSTLETSMDARGLFYFQVAMMLYLFPL